MCKRAGVKIKSIHAAIVYTDPQLAFTVLEKRSDKIICDCIRGLVGERFVAHVWS